MKKFLLSLFAGILAASIVNAGVLDWAIKGGDNGGAFGKLADDDTVNTNGRPAGYTVYLFFCTDYDAVVALLNGGEAFDLDAFEDYALASTDANNNTSKAQVLSKAGANGGAIISSEIQRGQTYDIFAVAFNTSAGQIIDDGISYMVSDSRTLTAYEIPDVPIVLNAWEKGQFSTENTWATLGESVEPIPEPTPRHSSQSASQPLLCAAKLRKGRRPSRKSGSVSLTLPYR